MSKQVTIIGYGPVGEAASRLLVRQGWNVVVGQRKRPTALASGITYRFCDLLDRESVRQLVRGSSQVVLAAGMSYDRVTWSTSWPIALNNVLDACAEISARLVFVDNLYMYGPQTEPLREDMRLTDWGHKPKARAHLTRLWQEAARQGRVKVAALRVPDFYGPLVSLAHLGATAFGKLAEGKRAQFIMPVDQLHDFAYVPDVGRAVATLVEAPDDAFNQAWHMPCAETRTMREILQIGADALGVKARLFALPLAALPILGHFVPMMREMAEMQFQWDRPYRVSAEKWRKNFWSDVTSFEIGAAETARSFASQMLVGQTISLPS
jgi:nucleoside-diphosphate-sugar epimerase